MSLAPPSFTFGRLSQLGLAVAVLALCGNLCAQTAALKTDGAPPEPPFVRETFPDRFRWSVEYAYGEGASRPTAPASEGKPITKRETVRTGEVMLERSTFEGGAVVDLWTRGSVSSLEKPGYPHIVVRRGGGAAGFPELDWVTAANFIGQENVGGTVCNVYRGEFYPLRFADRALYEIVTAEDATERLDMGEEVPVVAYIDAASRLPKELWIGGDRRVYTYGAAPTAMLVVPERNVAAMRDVSDRIQSLTSPLSTP